MGQLISFDRMKRQLALTTDIDEIKQRFSGFMLKRLAKV